METVNPQFPLYIPSKGRYEVRYTSDYLTYMGVPHYIIVEEQEYENYKSKTKENKFVTIIILDKKFQDNYHTLDDLGSTKSKGPGPARNFAWAHSISNGHDWHWVMDDNIVSFYRANRNRQIRVENGAIFRAMEDFCLRYENIGMAGPNYHMFFPRRAKVSPVVFNTRIYSCNLIRNDIPFRWRGRYNEDTILSIDMLKSGWCTAQFNAFLQEKVRTQVLGGGNTEAFYAKEGTLPKSKMLVDMYPEICELKMRFGRVHHYCDYRVFKKNKLQLNSGIHISENNNEYGMTIKQIN